MKRLSAAGVICFAVVHAAACGGSGDRVDRTGGAADTVAETVSDSVPGLNTADSATAAPDTAAGADPFRGFDLDTGPATNAVERRVALLLRNYDARTAIVYADGGAGEVLLDSVPPGAESRIDLLSRAGAIALRSVTPEGELLHAGEVSPGSDTVVDVIVGPAPSAP